MSFSIVIPSRYASSRLPGKPLLDIGGKPMVQRVYEQACLSEAVDVVIATDDQRISDACKSFDAKVVMTSSEHPSGTDRIQEVTTTLGLPDDHVVVNVQGDEPLIPPENINQVASNLNKQSSYSLSTLCEQISDVEAVFDPQVVKVVFDRQGRALTFSRAPIPWDRDRFANDPNDRVILTEPLYYRHIGIYAYRVNFLNDYIGWPPCLLEQTESLEQLRALWHSRSIHVEEAVVAAPGGIDTELDLQRVRKLFQ